MPPIIRDERGRFVPVVRPKLWQTSTVRRSRDRTDQIGRARKRLRANLATTQWISELDRRGIYELEACGIEWLAVEAWLDGLNPQEGSVARRFVKSVLQVLSDHEAPLSAQNEVYNELYRRLIAAGVVD
ncbi:hypothetical protein ABIF65_006786 [Bradyrhizobium japonicum]|uniref:hypothetical protein n=1 Tax=Bradyrhizobium japonicum TaxID=375 RepID=UPI00048A01FF|nr:hypothetical protein [Bradyrhizobium japonicum]WLB99396.1 hypothetical protein QIH92_08090 [Bradyrhizobium japonicum USDA 123]MCP1745108.1 hypothetical protein [Bradyrhizobium japonicum]MCP1776046.1 hypothetical protein [Bradyrhizobium japonicum]MCP1862739.1 hypothetical protein [Bradyrhizobium japonicum]MCP1893594.1 hypothetical protein [Bradyrhizobium japonicum]